jgi:hypothetical protein
MGDRQQMICRRSRIHTSETVGDPSDAATIPNPSLRLKSKSPKLQTASRERTPRPPSSQAPPRANHANATTTSNPNRTPLQLRPNLNPLRVFLCVLRASASCSVAPRPNRLTRTEPLGRPRPLHLRPTQAPPQPPTQTAHLSNSGPISILSASSSANSAPSRQLSPHFTMSMLPF